MAKNTAATETASTEVVASSAPASIVGASVKVGGRAFKVKAQVTRNVLKQEDNSTIYVRIIGEIYTGEELKNSGTSGPKMEPARLVKVDNLETGEEALIIVNKVLEGALIESFPPVTVKDENGNETVSQTYVGKELAIQMLPAPEGKRYKRFRVYELEAE